MVAITDDDIASLPEERSREIEVLEFVPAADGTRMMFDRSYFWSLIQSRRNRMCCWLRHSPRPDRMAIVHFIAAQQAFQAGGVARQGFLAS